MKTYKTRNIIAIALLMIIGNAHHSSSFAQLPPISQLDAGAIEEGAEIQRQLQQQKRELKRDLKPQEDEKIDTQEILPSMEQDADKNQLKVLIKGFKFNNSQILKKEQLDNLTNPLLGKESSIEEIKNVVKEINNLYVNKGYITARAFLPPQKVQDGIIEIKLVEGHLGAYILEGNKYTKDNYILDKMHLKPGELFKLSLLEKDILKFNRTNTVSLRANLKPGKEFGTTDIQLIAKDTNPYHIMPSMDNTGRETVGVLRGGLGFFSDSLLGYRDNFSMGYSRARSTDIAYSNYFFPVGNRGTEVGGTFSFSNIKISKGFFKDLNIEGNSYNFGGMIKQRFISTPRFEFSGDFGFNAKNSTTFFDEEPLFVTRVRSLALGLNFLARDSRGRWLHRSAITQGFDLFHGGPSFFKYNGNLTRIHSFGHGIVGIFRGAMQLTNDNLFPLEQFQIGGSSSVRGYSEGLLIGDKGYFISAEFRLPLPFLPKKIGKLNVRDRFQGVVFCDHGGAYLDDMLGADGEKRSANHQNYLTSVGLGLRGSITQYVSGRIDWGFGLGNRERPQPTARMHFGLQANPF